MKYNPAIASFKENAPNKIVEKHDTAPSIEAIMNSTEHIALAFAIILSDLLYLNLIINLFSGIPSENRTRIISYIS